MADFANVAAILINTSLDRTSRLFQKRVAQERPSNVPINLRPS
jgi:hypothetical protein